MNSLVSSEELQFHCRNCSTATRLKPAGYYQDGTQMFLFSCCERDGGVFHGCAHDSLTIPPTWLPLLLAGVSIVCPNCKRAYDLGVKIEPAYPELGQALKAVGLFAGIFVLIGVVGSALEGKKRRRR